MNRIKFFIVFTILASSCNKEYSTIGLNLIDNDPFSTDLEEIVKIILNDLCFTYKRN